MASEVLPTREDELCDAVADAARTGAKLRVRGGGSKDGFGAPTPDAQRLDLSGLTGVIDYDPAELVLTVRAGTPLAEVQALVAGAQQRLAFDPFDHGPIYGATAGAATIGGVIAAGASGSQRLSSGAARDHLLGFQAVTGRAELITAGAKVVKNVTGYDLPKLAAGSWGRLFAMTEVTLKVLPRPREARTCLIHGLDPAQAIAAMSRAMGAPAEIAAAAYLPAGPGDAQTTLGLCIQGFGPSVTARCAMVETLLADLGTVERAAPEAADAFWSDLRTLAPLPAEEAPLWRINVAPRASLALVAVLEKGGAQWLMDWAGGLIWAASTIDPATLRSAAEQAGGHAVLVRAPEALRVQVPALHPQLPGIAALEARVRRAFDPYGVFETERF